MRNCHLDVKKNLDATNLMSVVFGLIAMSFLVPKTCWKGDNYKRCQVYGKWGNKP